MSPHLDWPGAWNARHLGGLSTRSGHLIRDHALLRSESPHQMTEAGWSALRDAGVSTLIDLRDTPIEDLLELDALRSLRDRLLEARS